MLAQFLKAQATIRYCQWREKPPKRNVVRLGNRKQKVKLEHWKRSAKE